MNENATTAEIKPGGLGSCTSPEELRAMAVKADRHADGIKALIALAGQDDRLKEALAKLNADRLGGYLFTEHGLAVQLSDALADRNNWLNLADKREAPGE